MRDFGTSPRLPTILRVKVLSTTREGESSVDVLETGLGQERRRPSESASEAERASRERKTHANLQIDHRSL